MNRESFVPASELPPEHTVLLFAPFYNRSGYGMCARALVAAWWRLGIRVRIVPVDEVSEGIDDCDMEWLKSLESTPLTKPLAAVFFHVPSPGWLALDLPADCLRIMYTTFDSSAQGNLPPAAWVSVCKQMDQLWLHSAQEADVWIRAGIEAERIHVVPPPHGWVDNPTLPPLPSVTRTEADRFRFLCIGMFQPRRRWDALLEAFLLEFAEEPRAELYLKVNYPSWHPIPGQPQRDLAAMIEGLRSRTPSQARIIIDESMGTRLGICHLVDTCDFYVSTDTCTTAPILESLIRGKRVIIPSYGIDFPAASRLLLPEDPNHSMPMTPEMLAYQPHHEGRPMPLLWIDDIRKALRQAFETPVEALARPWEGWDHFMDTNSKLYVLNPEFVAALAKGFGPAQGVMRPARIRWEGSQFLYHSLAHVNRQMCLGLVDSKKAEIELIPYEVDQFDGRKDPRFSVLAEHVQKPLSSPCDVHVRHQWPPNFQAPKEGAWVMIQPWEFGGIPAQWVAVMRELVDELWVPTSWVRDCYIKSGVPADKVVVVPNGVDTARFTPEGERFALRTKKRFKLLFLGGTIHRKGIDVLLAAYRKTFTSSDDVCLVIKGQAGMTYQGTELDAILSEWAKEPDAPEIEYRLEAFDEATLVSLYRACDAFVLPYRGEGFGLPIAEAMACGLPVIVTGRGAAMDFVKEEWAYLVESSPRSIPSVDRYQAPLCGFWLEEPSEASLMTQLRRAFEHPEEVWEKGRRGRAYAESSLGWDRSAKTILERVEVLARRVPIRMCRFHSRPATDVPRCMFHLAPGPASTEWVQALLAYAHAFQPGDPVALGLLVEPSHRDELTQAVLKLMQRAGHTSFPDVMVLDGQEEIDAWRQNGGELIDLGQWDTWKGHPLLDRLERSLALFAKA